MDGENVSFSYYIYLAFNNNNSRDFTVSGLMKEDFFKQGAFFMHKCLGMFFKNEVDEVVINNQSKLPSLNKIKEEMKQELDSNTPQGRCLIHIDEHRSMIHHANQEEAALFRRGTIEALAEIPGVVIVVTYTKLQCILLVARTYAASQLPCLCSISMQWHRVSPTSTCKYREDS
jgi:hypothetical protein